MCLRRTRKFIVLSQHATPLLLMMMLMNSVGLNTPGVRNGVIDVRVDGQQKIYFDKMNWRLNAGECPDSRASVRQVTV